MKQERYFIRQSSSVVNDSRSRHLNTDTQTQNEDRSDPPSVTLSGANPAGRSGAAIGLATQNGPQAEPDIELQQISQKVAGYAELARFIASDKVFCIFRRFDRMSIRCLLYLQDEISELEAKIDALDNADLRSGDDLALYSLHSRRHEQNEQRKALMKELSEKLYVYPEHLSVPIIIKQTLTHRKKRDSVCIPSAHKWRRPEISISLAFGIG